MDDKRFLLIRRTIVFTCPPRHAAGFSLIELCIVLVIVSILLGGTMALLTGQMQKASQRQTQDTMKLITERIAVYLDQTGRLPCPAALTAQSHDDRFGFAMNCEDPGGTINGAYKLLPGRDGQSVIAGRVPNRTLNIPDKDGKDGWGRDIYYVVTRALTDIGTYDQEQGAIAVVDEHDKFVTDPGDRVQYLLLSFGPDGIVMDDPACDSDILDGENCRSNDAIFRYAYLALGGQHYDDILSYHSWIPPLAISGAKCDLMKYLQEQNVPEDDIYEAIQYDMGLVYPELGDIVFVCNKKILRSLGESECVVMSCGEDGILRKRKMI